MKKYLIILIVFLASCQKEPEPKSLIVTNGITQRLYSRYSTPTLIESVLILYIGDNGKYVRTDKFPISYASVQNLTSYQVTSTILDDNIVSVRILVWFSEPKGLVAVFNHTSPDIPISEGINTYTITDSDLDN